MGQKILLKGEINMNFQELIKETPWDIIENYIREIEHYTKEINDYRSFYDRLQSIKVAPNEKGRYFGAHYETYPSDEGDWDNLEVGMYESPGKSFALDGIPWEQVLSYEIPEDLLQKFPKDEFIFSVLYDISSDGFHQDKRDI